MGNQISQTGGVLNFPLHHLLISILRTFFKLLYHQFAWAYDWVARIVSLGEWQHWVSSVLPYLSGHNVLEIGFGPGHLQVAIDQKNIQAFGLDESIQMVNIAHHRLIDMGQIPHLARGDAQFLPFGNESFQQVVMTFPAEFLLQVSTFNEIRRVLVIGGTVVILPLAWVTGRKPLHRVVAWLNRITGEAPDWNESSLEPLKDLGFIVSWEMINLRSSKVLIIQLFKSEA
jgi:ubiquinone/menaquinone biosynthesis C-methylase UbiE